MPEELGAKLALIGEGPLREQIAARLVIDAKDPDASTTFRTEDQSLGVDVAIYPAVSG